MITPGPTVSSKPRELLADVLIQKVLMPPVDADFDLGLDDVDDVVADVAAKKPTAPAQPKVPREVRNLQATPACWLPASRGVPASAFMAIALRALADYSLRPRPVRYCPLSSRVLWR